MVRSQYPCVSSTRAGADGVSSAFVNVRPSTGCTRSAASVPSVTNSASMRSGSPIPVTDTEPLSHNPKSWNTRPSSR